MRAIMQVHWPARLPKRALLHAFIAFALLFAQQAALFHAASHLGQDLRVASEGAKGAPPLDHSGTRCLAFQAIGSALACAAPAPALAAASVAVAPNLALPQARAARVELHSRGPPVSFSPS